MNIRCGRDTRLGCARRNGIRDVLDQRTTEIREGRGGIDAGGLTRIRHLLHSVIVVILVDGVAGFDWSPALPQSPVAVVLSACDLAGSADPGNLAYLGDLVADVIGIDLS